MSYKIFLSVLFVVALFSACSSNDPSPSAIAPQPIEASNTEPKNEIKNLFETKCSACHGNDGTAGLSNAANLKTSKMDSTSLVQIITNGKASMPSFKRQLTEDEIARLISYVKTLRK